jgi:hypothetical protein
METRILPFLFMSFGRRPFGRLTFDRPTLSQHSVWSMEPFSWEPQWSDFHSGQNFDNFDKVVVKLLQFFCLDLQTSIFINTHCGYSAWLYKRVSLEGGWDTGFGRSSRIQPNSRILIESSLAGKAGRKTDSPKLIFKTCKHINFI